MTEATFLQKGLLWLILGRQRDRGDIFALGGESSVVLGTSPLLFFAIQRVLLTVFSAWGVSLK